MKIASQNISMNSWSKMEELIEFYHRAKKIDYEIKLQKYKTGQHQRLTRKFLCELQKIPEYKFELGEIVKAIKRFFKGQHE